MRYELEISRALTFTVEVEADSEEAAREIGETRSDLLHEPSAQVTQDITEILVSPVDSDATRDTWFDVKTYTPEAGWELHGWTLDEDEAHRRALAGVQGGQRAKAVRVTRTVQDA